MALNDLLKVKLKSKTDTARLLVLSKDLNQLVYETCLQSMRRLILETGTSIPSEMYFLQRASFEAYLEIFSLFFPGASLDEILEVIRFEKEQKTYG
jgi:hypothetical protein